MIKKNNYDFHRMNGIQKVKWAEHYVVSASICVPFPSEKVKENGLTAQEMLLEGFTFLKYKPKKIMKYVCALVSKWILEYSAQGLDVLVEVVAEDGYNTDAQICTIRYSQEKGMVIAIVDSEDGPITEEFIPFYETNRGKNKLLGGEWKLASFSKVVNLENEDPNDGLGKHIDQLIKDCQEI